VVWAVDEKMIVDDINPWTIASDSMRGELRVIDPNYPCAPGCTPQENTVLMRPAADPGDQTVPSHSADQQMRSGKFKGIFRQGGYEHQASFNDTRALLSTLYSLVRIAETMTWTKP
jgi:hypothetical protein